MDEKALAHANRLKKDFSLYMADMAMVEPNICVYAFNGIVECAFRVNEDGTVDDLQDCDCALNWSSATKYMTAEDHYKALSEDC